MHKDSRKFMTALLTVLCCLGAVSQVRADVYDAAVAHPGRSAADLKRDQLDHPAEILRSLALTPGMRVADILTGDGYYSELASYIVGPQGTVLAINNAAFDDWSDGDRQKRLEGNRLPNVQHETIDLNDMHLAAASLDAVLLVKVYHDLYWVDSSGKWPKVDAGAVLTQLATALKSGGVLLVVDHSAKAGHGSSDASALHRIDESYAVHDFESHGFKLLSHSDALRRPDDKRDQVSYRGAMLGKTDRFVLVFRKTG